MIKKTIRGTLNTLAKAKTVLTGTPPAAAKASKREAQLRAQQEMLKKERFKDLLCHFEAMIEIVAEEDSKKDPVTGEFAKKKKLTRKQPSEYRDLFLELPELMHIFSARLSTKKIKGLLEREDIFDPYREPPHPSIRMGHQKTLADENPSLQLLKKYPDIDTFSHHIVEKMLFLGSALPELVANPRDARKILKAAVDQFEMAMENVFDPKPKSKTEDAKGNSPTVPGGTYLRSAIVRTYIP